MNDYVSIVVVISVLLVGLAAIGFLVAPHIDFSEAQYIEPYGKAYYYYSEPEPESSTTSSFLQKAVQDPGRVRFY
jgi:hypothetical protein